VPRTLLFEQVFEATEGLLRVVLRRALNSRDSVVWLVLVGRTTIVIVVVVTPSILVVVAARVVLALAVIGVVLGIGLALLIGP
jgi:hypothetical protein